MTKDDPMKPWLIWRYRAVLDRVIDGDTIVVDIDLGFRVRSKQILRLAGINAPELSSPDVQVHNAAVAAQCYLASLVRDQDLIVRTEKTEKYGRWLAWITNASNLDVNQAMIDAGVAVPYDGKGKVK